MLILHTVMSGTKQTDEEVSILRAVYDEAKELEANFKAQASACSHCAF
jgi:hypothetical protein